MEKIAPYTSSLDHLLDGLRWLDCLIHLHLLRQRARQPANPLEGFKGLVVTEEEVAHLLRGRPEEFAASPELDAAAKELARLAETIQTRRTASIEHGVPLALPGLAEIFSLDAFEEDALLITLAPELSRKYDKFFAYLHDDVTKKKPSVDLLLTLLCPTLEMKLQRRAAFEPGAPLLRYRLIEMSDDSPDMHTPLLARGLKLDDRIVGELLGTRRLDPRLESVAQLIHTEARWGSITVSAEVQTRLDDFVTWHSGESDISPALIHFVGPEGCGARYLAKCVSHQLGLPLLLGDAAKMLGRPVPFEELMWLLGREASLQPAVLGLDHLDANGAAAQLEAVLESARVFSRVSFLFSQRPLPPRATSEEVIYIEVPLAVPDAGRRGQLWESRLAGATSIDSEVDAGALASKFRLTPGQIDRCLGDAVAFARWRSPADPRISADDLYRGCRAQSGAALGSLARKIEPIYHWEDIVLPDDAIAQLRELCDRVNQRHRVLSEWGFARKLSLGLGVNALFAGPSGTGKTMAAEILANELALDLYKIDLAGVVSKYIGETEKNLNAVFAAAENSNAILLIDEADALFGKRSEVRDSHDRYANIEISYLLQKMEEYSGIAILATNLRQNLDESFTRRLAFTVHFPFPDEAERQRIWKGIWPAEMPLADDVDIEFLARQFKLSGGNIKNVVLGAAYLAASEGNENGGVVTMQHLRHATRREFQKMGRALTPAELDPPMMETASAVAESSSRAA